MARYLSKSPGFNKTVRQPVTGLINGPHGPERMTLELGIMAQFEQSGLTPYERELAKERFNFTGLAEGEDPLKRVSMFDTDEYDWDPKLKAEIEAVLDEGQSDLYFRIIDEKTPAPWATYDKQNPKQILDTAAVTGANLELVIAYERENKNRASLIEQLEAAGAGDPEPLIAA